MRPNVQSHKKFIANPFFSQQLQNQMNKYIYFFTYKMQTYSFSVRNRCLLSALHITSYFLCSFTNMVCTSCQTFRMLNVRPLHKTARTATDSTLGFPLLEELCIATTSFSYMTDKDLLDILFGSPKLRVLDLRGCSRITPSGLAALPCQGRLFVRLDCCCFFCMGILSQLCSTNRNFMLTCTFLIVNLQNLSVCSGASISAAALLCQHRKQGFTWLPRNGV